MPERRHVSRILGLAAIAAVLGSLALIAAPASANVSHTFKTTFGSATSTPPDPYPISEPTDVAEDQESGDLYVTDPPPPPGREVGRRRPFSLHVRQGSQQNRCRNLGTRLRSRAYARPPDTRATSASRAPRPKARGPTNTRPISPSTTTPSAKATSTWATLATTRSPSSTRPATSSPAGASPAKRTAPTTRGCRNSDRSSASRSAGGARHRARRSRNLPLRTAPCTSGIIDTGTTSGVHAERRIHRRQLCGVGWLKVNSAGRLFYINCPIRRLQLDHGV